MENELAQLSINDEEEEIIHIPTDPSTENRGETTKLVGCFLTTSTIHFPAMKSTMANLWHPVKGVRICDLGEKRVLKGSPWTFNHHLLVLYKLELGEDPLQDLSIRAQSRRSLSMNNIWLREERDGDNGGTDAEFGGFRMGQKHPGWKIKYGKSVDPVLGFNLEGGSSYA
ncbi:hypothetical protein Goarm_022376, partial [Gossypium armourianum]|nr:hypothetical protein [Gossypium armourianum]